MSMTSHWRRMQNAEKEEKEENTEMKQNLVQEVKIWKKCEQELVWRGNAAKQMAQYLLKLGEFENTNLTERENPMQ